MMSFDPETYEALMLKYLEQQATPEEQAELATWLNASPDHRQQYEQLKRVWTITANPTAIPPPDKAKAWQNVATKARLRQAEDRPAAPRSTKKRAWNRAWLALPVFLASVAVIWLMIGQSPSMIEITAALGQVQTITLSDGTVVRLQSTGTLRYPEDFNQKDRIVLLEGLAYFDVRTTELPFHVQSNEADIRVVGTQFSVRSKEETTEVVVTEGRVHVVAQKERAQSVELGPGEGVTVSATQINPLDQQIRQDTEDWIAGTIMFDSTPFPEAIARLSRIWNTSIIISTPDLESQTVTGGVRLEDIEQALNTLCLTLENTCSVRLEEENYFIF